MIFNEHERKIIISVILRSFTVDTRWIRKLHKFEIPCSIFVIQFYDALSGLDGFVLLTRALPWSMLFRPFRATSNYYDRAKINRRL